MVPDTIPEGLTFDDVLLLPARSAVVPTETDTRTWLTSKIQLNLPVVIAAMDAIGESHLGIAIEISNGELSFCHQLDFVK
jgi:IMP dehydrogenase